MNDLAIGAASGLAATVPMTWAMDIMHRYLPHHERHPLPPRQITERVAAEAVGWSELDDPEHFWLTLASHFGYGAAAGVLYAPLAKRLPVPPILGGTAYGLIVWAGSYFGLLPALGILPSATKHPVRRTALMFAAHVVWGSALGSFIDLLETTQEAGGRPSLGHSTEPHGRH